MGTYKSKFCVAIVSIKIFYTIDSNACCDTFSVCCWVDTYQKTKVSRTTSTTENMPMTDQYMSQAVNRMLSRVLIALYDAYAGY